MERNLRELIGSIGASLSYGDVLAAEVLAKISTAIFKARIDRKMTQKEFASLLGVSQGMISKWESEDYNFTIEALANICDKLDWDLNIDLRPRSCSTYNHYSLLSNKSWKTSNTNTHDMIGFEVAS